MYKAETIADGKGKPGQLAIEFQGKALQNCLDLDYWFRWGEYIFDIRRIFQVYCKIPPTDIDPTETIAAKFRRQMTEMMKLVATDDFHQIMEHAAILAEEDENLSSDPLNPL